MSDTAESRRYDADADPLAAFLWRYCRDEVEQLARQYPEEKESVMVDWFDMHRFDDQLAVDYLHEPATVREELEDALLRLDLPVDVAPTTARVRVTNLDDARRFHIGEYDTDAINEAVAIRGQVSQLGQVTTAITEAAIKCERCGAEYEVPQDDAGEELQLLNECPGCERQGPFEVDLDASTTERRQLLRLTPPPEKAAGAGQHLDVELTEDLVRSVTGGERVEVSGDLRAHQQADGKRIYEFQQRANHVRVLEGTAENVPVDEHREAIERVRSTDDPVAELKASFAPTLARDDRLDAVIEAVILQLFGATRTDEYRGDIHVLVLGDAGTAKTAILEEAETVAPRAKYKSGRSVSGTGLTAAAVADDFGAEQWSLKAGLLVLANDGLAVLDEIDKVPEEAVKAAHSALESQRVSVSKAGLDAEMPARTALLAAGNPEDGRFDPHRPIGDQIGFPPTLLSRFDLKFMLEDRPDEERDEEVSTHLARSFVNATRKQTGRGEIDPELERALDPEAFQAYIAHARETVHPTIEDEAVYQRAVDHYQTLRGDVDKDDPVPVTPRNLEAVLRLAHASARARFSEVVETRDVDRALRLVRDSLEQLGKDPETGALDADIIETGTSTSQRDRMKTLRGIITDLASEYDDGAPVPEILDRAEVAGIDRSKASHGLDNLRQQGRVYEPEAGHLRLAD